MTTPLSKPIIRQTVDGYVVRLAPEGLYVREKGRRLEVGPLAYGVLYQRGVQAQVDRDRTATATQHQPRSARKIYRGLLSH